MSQSIEERLDRFERRQESALAIDNRMLEILILLRDAQAELIAWLKQPPGTELSDAIRELALAVNTQTVHVARLSQVVYELQTIVLHKP